jgi:CheY-like chemotaxis protein
VEEYNHLPSKRTDLTSSDSEYLLVNDKTESLSEPQEPVDPFRIIANLTHELKTPLHSILTVASLLKTEVDGGLNEEQQKQVGIILRNGEQLLELITDLLSHASSSTKTRRLNIKKINPFEGIKKLVQDVVPLAEQKKVTISSELEYCPKEFFSDEGLFYRIVSNILDNAIKFSKPEGEVYLSIEKSLSQGMIIRIVDSGIGMNQTTKEKLFTAFYQEDASSTRQYGGVGLGLALVKSSIEQLGGSILVQSELGKGTIFTIELPDISDRAVHHRILIADNDDGIRNALKMLLKKEGYEVEICSIREMSEKCLNSFPSLLLLDIGIVGEAEMVVLQSAKKLLSEAGIPIIGMTTSSHPRERSRAFSEGVSDVLSKPFETEELIARVKLLLE